ncbi:MAG: hypothetical protein LAO79_11685 [Acidobacteriia bacterium]|nr:hypothetical protein [Terriglobia bacterium]
MDTRQYRDLNCLNGLIANFGDAGNNAPGAGGALREHLQAARRNLLGAMAGEYSLSLRLAGESAADVQDKAARAEIIRVLGILTAPVL